MILPGEPDFLQVIGAGFHQDALADGVTVDERIDRYRSWSPQTVLDASATGHVGWRPDTTTRRWRRS